MEEPLRQNQLQEPSNALQSARLLSATFTTGWLDWFHGQLWLLPQGLLRVPLGPTTTLLHSMGPTTNVRNGKTWILSQDGINRLIISKVNLWVPRKHITKAYLHHGFTTDRLRLELSNSRTVKLLWIPWDKALPQLEAVLQQWIGDNVVRD